MSNGTRPIFTVKKLLTAVLVVGCTVIGVAVGPVGVNGPAGAQANVMKAPPAPAPPTGEITPSVAQQLLA
jgi:hypothetical protein